MWPTGGVPFGFHRRGFQEGSPGEDSGMGAYEVSPGGVHGSGPQVSAGKIPRSGRQETPGWIPRTGPMGGSPGEVLWRNSQVGLQEEFPGGSPGLYPGGFPRCGPKQFRRRVPTCSLRKGTPVRGSRKGHWAIPPGDPRRGPHVGFPRMGPHKGSPGEVPTNGHQ